MLTTFRSFKSISVVLLDSTYVCLQATGWPSAAQAVGIGLSPEAAMSGCHGTVLRNAELQPAELSMTAGVYLMLNFTHYML